MDAQPPPAASDTAPAEFLAGGGEMGALMRAHDWSRSPLGPPRDWPDALRTAVSLCLNSHFPILLWWGPELVTLYNDAWCPAAGSRKHPRGLGRPGIESWPEVWDTIGPQLEGVMRDGIATWSKDVPLLLDRHGYLEETFFTYACSPIRHADGRIGGVFTPVCETTGHVIGARRLEVLRRLGERAAGHDSVAGTCRAIDAVLAGQPDTLASLIYLRDGNGRARLMSAPAHGVPAEVEIAGDDDWAIAATIRSDSLTLLDDPPASFGALLPQGTWPERHARAAVLPIAAQDRDDITDGALLIGLNPRRQLDDDYLGFLRRVAGHAAIAIAAAAAQRARTDELQEVLDAVPTAVWVTRDPQARVAWANRQAAELLRLEGSGIYTLGNRKGLGYTVLRDGIEAPREVLPFARAVRGEETAPEELVVRFNDGTERHVVTQARPLRDARGIQNGAVMAVVDITERKLAQAALQEANATLEARVADRTAALEATIKELRAQMEERERMEATLRQMQRLEAIGQLTAGVAHDFNNLLTVILGNIEFLERDLTGPPARRLATLRAAAERGASLTGQLLAFARRQQLQPRPVDLNQIVTGMADLLRTSVGGTVRIQTDLLRSLWPAMVDQPQMELVILNLALNARDAMADGGTLTIATANTRLEAPERPEQPPAGDYVTLRVSDTGTGMDQEVLDRAFEPFFTTKPAGKGSGLGLAQVYGFAQQSGGDVMIASRTGEGTTVTVHLPRAPALAAVSFPGSAGPRWRARILLADDDEAVREVTAAMLEEAGYAVVRAGGAPAALAVLDGGAAVDLLVADFVMPGMNGLQLARAARERRRGLPVLFVTGYAATTLLADIADAAVLRKPFHSDDLQRNVAALLHARHAGRVTG